MQIPKFNQTLQQLDYRSSLKRLKRSDDNLKLPESFEIGQAIGGGDCFFDSVAKSLVQIKTNGEFTIKLLRELCHKYALENEWIKTAVVNDARLKSQISSTVKDNDIWNAYLLGIRYTADDIEKMKSSNEQVDKNLYKTLTSADYGETLVAPIWGRSEIEGRIICEKYNVKLHVVEKHNVGGKGVWIDQVVDKLGSRSVDSINYDEENTIHIVNKGHLHFEPVLSTQGVKYSEHQSSDFSDYDDNQSQTKLNEDLMNTVRGNDSEEEKLKKIEDLLDEGADINFKDANRERNTPLHAAVRKGESKVVKLLIEKGANVNSKNTKNKTPLDVAKRLDKQDIILQFNQARDLAIKRKNTGENKPEDSSPKKPRISFPTEVKEFQGVKRLHIEESESETSQIKKIKMSEDYSASGLKHTLHGNIYQLKLLMLFLKRGLDEGYSFRLATEMDAAEKFDDLVFQYENERKDGIVYRFLQAKHKQDESKKITVNDLLTERDNEFSLQKYFISYRRIKQNDFFNNAILEDFIIATNIDIDDSLKESFERIEGQDSILDVQGTSKEAKRLKFKIDGYPERERITSILENTSDLNRLAKKLAEYVLGNKKMELRDPLFKFYHGALAKEVIDIKSKKFFNQFFNDQQLPNEVKKFREALKKEIGEAKWKEVKNKQLELSSGFGCNAEHTNLPNNYVTDQEIKDFFKKLVFAVNQPNEIELGKVIKNEIGVEFNNIDRKNVYSRFQKKMLNWMKEKKGRFFSYEEGKDFFEKIKEEILGAIWFDVRDPVVLFTGRVKQLKELHTALQSGGEAVILQKASVTGLGGIGKSELARKYISEHSQDYDNRVVWINAASYSTIVESFRRLAQDSLGINTKDIEGKEKDVESILREVHRFFARKKSLFVFDNAEEYITLKEGDKGINRFLPSGPNKPYVLITSRNQEWGSIKQLPLDVFTKEEAAEFIRKALEDIVGLQENEVKRLAEELQYFPLALQQAVAYIKRENKESKLWGKKAFTISSYLERYKKKAEELFREPLSEKVGELRDKLQKQKFNREYDRYTETVLTTWTVTIDKIKRKRDGKPALKILDVLAYFAPEKIPMEEIFLELIKGTEIESEEIEETLYDAVKLLNQYSMVNLEEGVLNIHRLVQQVTRINLEEQSRERDVLREALSLLEKPMKEGGNPMGSIYTSHAVSAWDYASKYDELAKEFSGLPNCIIDKLNDGIRYQEAYVFAVRASELLEKVLGPDHTDTLTTRSNMALVLDNQGRYGEALQIYQEVFKKQKEILEPENSGTLATGNNMALVLGKQGKYEEALQIYQEIFEKKKETLGLENPSTLTTRSNIALVLDNQGKYEEALQIYQEVLDIGRHVGPESPGTLTTKNNIAGVLDKQGKYEEALQIYREVFEKQEEILGAENPDTLTTRNNIAEVLGNQGKYEEALQIYQEVFEKQKEILGLEDPNALTTRNNIAGVLDKQGKYEEALQIYQEVFEKQKEILGLENPSTLNTKSNMALILDSQGKYEEALQIYQEVFEKQKEILGLENPSTLTTKSNMALVLNNQGKYEEALQIYQEVFEKQKEVLGPENPSTLNTRSNMALVLDKQGKYEEALQVYQEVLDIEKHIGQENPDTLTTKNNIAGVLYNQGKYEEALQIYQEVFEKKKETLGLKNPSTLTTRNNIAGVLDGQGKYEEALQIYQEVFEKQKEILGPENPSTLNTRSNMALVLDEQGKYEEALQVYQEVLDIERRVGPENPDTLTTRNNIAVVLFKQGKYEEALQIYQEVFENQEKMLGLENPDTLTTRNNIAGVLSKQGKYEEALQVYQEVLDIERRVGPENPDTLTTRNNIAGVLFKQGKYEEALQVYQEVFEKQKEILGPDHLDTLTTWNNIAGFNLFSSSSSESELESYSSSSEIESHKKQQKVFLHLSKFLSNNFLYATTISIKQGLYISSFEARGVAINGKCAAITRTFSQSLFLDLNLGQQFLKSMQTSAELYERLAQGKQISLREEKEIFDLSKFLDTFEQQLDSPTSSLPSSLSHIKSYKTFDDLLKYVSDLTGDFAIHLVTSNHVVAIYRVGDIYAYFDSNVALVSDLKSIYQLTRVLEKAVTFAGYKLAEDGFLVEHFDVTQANNALTTKQKQIFTKPIQTERHLLSIQDQELGSIDVNGKKVLRTALYDFGAKLHLDNGAIILINAEMSSEDLIQNLRSGKIKITAREYLQKLRGNLQEVIQGIVQTTSSLPFLGSINEIKNAKTIQELVLSEDSQRLNSYELNKLLKSPIEKSIKALPYYLEVAKTKHWPDRLTNAAGRIQLIRGVHGAVVSCDREKGNTKDCLLNTGEISLSLVSQLIEDKVVQNIPKLIKSLKTVKFGAHILRGGAAIISSPFDIYDIIDSAIDLHNCEKGSNECKDAIAGVTFASTSLASGVVLTAIGAPGVGTAVGLAIMVAQGAYSGARMIEEFESYNLTFDENFRLFWNTFALQPVPKDMEYIKARKDIIDQVARQIWEQLQNRDEHVVDYATGLGEITFKEERECKPVQEGLDRYQSCTHRKVRIPTLSPNNATILMDLSGIKGNDYRHFLSRILPKFPAVDAEISCAPSFSGKNHERDYTLSNGYPLYSRSSTIVSYCEDAMVVTHKQRMNKIQIHRNKKVVFDLNLVNQGIIVGSDKRQNEFIVSQGKAKVLGGENTRNTFILTGDFTGTIFGGKNSTNILDVSNLSNSLYIDNLSPFDRTSYVQDYTTNKKQAKEQSHFYGINNVVISANTTVQGNGDRYTFYIKPNAGYSKINVLKGSIVFPETALLLDCDSFTYSPESNVLSMKFSNFTLDTANYFNRNQQICNFELIDKHGSVIEPLVDLSQNNSQEVKLFNLRAETDLTYNNITGWYENIAKASSEYQIYGTVRVKYPIAQERYGSYPNMIFGSEKSDVIPLTKETWYAEGRKGSDSYNVIGNRNSSITTEINNYAEDEVFDLLYMPVNSIKVSRDNNNLHLYSAGSTHSVKVKDYFLNSSYQHLTVIDENKDVFLPREDSLNNQPNVQLVPFYHATKDQYTFSLSAEKVASNSEVIVDARLDNIRLYRDGSNLLLMDDKPIIIKLESFYDKHESWQNLTINFWHDHHKDKLSSKQLFELSKLAINYQDEIKGAYYDNVKEYIVSASNSTIHHNQKFINDSLTTVEPNTKRVGVLALQDPSDIEVSVDNEDLVFFVTQNNATFTIKNWNDTDHRISALKFNQEIEVTGLDKFDLSQVSEIQPLINKAVLSSIATQQLEKLDSNVVNGIKYLLAVRGIENGIGTHKCLGFDSAEEEQQFISAYHFSYSSEKLSQVLHHNQASKALVWLVVKGYTDLSLENQSIDRKNNLNKCFNAVANKRVISRIVRKLEVGNIEDIIPNMESFIRHHKEALEDRIVNSLRSNTTEIDTEEGTHQRKRRDVRVEKDYKDYVFFNAQNNANSSLKGQQVTSGGNKLSSTNSGSRPSSWINDFVGWVKNSITGFLAPSTEQVSSNIVQPEISNALVDGFLILSDVGIRKFTGNKYKQPKHDSLLSPKELIEQRMDHTAINAINSFGKVYDFQNATSKVYDKPMTCLSSISLEKAVINMDSKKGIL